MNPTLIELNDDNRGDVPREVTHLVQLNPPKTGDHFVGYCRCRPSNMSPHWFVNDPDYAEADSTVAMFLYARAATPAEIAAHKPSAEVLVPVELLRECDELSMWFDMQADSIAAEVVEDEEYGDGEVSSAQEEKEMIQYGQRIIAFVKSLAQREGTWS